MYSKIVDILPIQKANVEERKEIEDHSSPEDPKASDLKVSSNAKNSVFTPQDLSSLSETHQLAGSSSDSEVPSLVNTAESLTEVPRESVPASSGKLVEGSEVVEP